MEVTITEHDYGFLKYVSDDLEWLLILAAYAVTDVIYNLSGICIVRPADYTDSTAQYLTDCRICTAGIHRNPCMPLFSISFCTSQCIILRAEQEQKISVG